MARLAVLFAGQAAQSAGMSKELLNSSRQAVELFAVASKIAGKDLAAVGCFGSAVAFL